MNNWEDNILGTVMGAGKSRSSRGELGVPPGRCWSCGRKLVHHDWNTMIKNARLAGWGCLDGKTGVRPGEEG